MIYDLRNAPPCARCGGTVDLEKFDGLQGVLMCRSCGHRFEVAGVEPPDPPPETEERG